VLYDSPVLHATVDDYRSHRGSTLNYVFEKLLLRKDRMHIASARQIASERHRFIEGFVREFFAEWDGEV
jgi:uncharacterized protein